MQLSTVLVNALLAAAATARYVQSDPATCAKDPSDKRDLEGGAEGEAGLDARRPMGGSSIQRRALSRTLCLRCCHAAAMFCDDACRATWNGGTGLSFWAMAACQSNCQVWGASCVAACPAI
ncbi:hypothetical protein E4U41_006400 [Claviceps citrina]|nr:hypothetical protein E4U41_006400 [Claviceps citrina]